MSNLNELKRSIEFNKHLSDTLGVLKDIAMSEYFALDKAKARFEKFKDSFESFFNVLNLSDLDHPFFHTGEGRPVIILVSSDEGFSGGVNNKVIHEGLMHDDAEQALFIALGARGVSYLEDAGHQCVSFPGIDSGELYKRTRELKNFIIEKTLAGEFSSVSVIYAKSISFVVQRVTTVKLLPCSELVHEHADSKVTTDQVILESDPYKILEYLVGIWIEEYLYEIFEDAKLSEFSARTVHLESSHDTLTQEFKKLRFNYFRSRRSVIDQSLRETYSSMLSKKEKSI